MAIGFRRVITFTTRDRMVHHGWLTPAAPGAALGGRTRIVANVRLRFTGESFHSHGWLTPAAPGPALDGRTRIIANVRRRFARAIRFTTTAGLRQRSWLCTPRCFVPGYLVEIECRCWKLGQVQEIGGRCR
jgi:hypothetical protein